MVSTEQNDAWRIISARTATKQEKRRYKKKMLLTEERPKTAVAIHIPADVLEELEKVAHEKEMSSIEALIQFYVGQGLRHDLVELRRRHAAEHAKQILGKHHIDPQIIEEVAAVMR